MPSIIATTRIDRGVALQPCPPFCVEHRDESTSPGDFNPGSAAHYGRHHVIVGSDDAPGNERVVSVQLFPVRNDYGRPVLGDEAPYGWLSVSAEGAKLTPDGLRALAAAALEVADELDRAAPQSAPHGGSR